MEEISKITVNGTTYNLKDEVARSQSGSGISYDTIYPVGSIYMSVNSTSPADLFGGTWERLSGRFLLGADSTYTAGSTGGESTHRLTTAEMPYHNHTGTTESSGSHTHGYNKDNKGNNEYIHTTNDGDTGADGGDNITGDTYKYPRSKSSASYHHTSSTLSSGAHTHSFGTSGSGGGGAHNNMPPYLSVYMWKRTA